MILACLVHTHWYRLCPKTSSLCRINGLIDCFVFFMQMLAFIASSLSLILLDTTIDLSLPLTSDANTVTRSQLAAFLSIGSLVLTYRRVQLGYHTFAQVFVGYIIGIMLGWVWHVHPLVTGPAVDAAVFGDDIHSLRLSKCAVFCGVAMFGLSKRWLPSHSSRDKGKHK